MDGRIPRRREKEVGSREKSRHIEMGGWRGGGVGRRGWDCVGSHAGAGRSRAKDSQVQSGLAWVHARRFDLRAGF